MGCRTYTDEDKEKIIKEFLPFIKYTAFRLSWNLPHHVTIDDLISCGLMGLMDALSRFELGKVKLKTYAELRIKGSMIDELRAAAWIPRSMRKKINNINDAKARLERKHNRAPDDVEVAKSMNLPLSDYFKILQYATSSNHIRFEDFRNKKYADSELNITECIPDPKAKSPLQILEEKDTIKELYKLIGFLRLKEEIIFRLYHDKELTMQEIADALSLTESRVCQLYNVARIKLKLKLRGTDIRPDSSFILSKTERNLAMKYMHPTDKVALGLISDDVKVHSIAENSAKTIGRESEAMLNEIT